MHSLELSGLYTAMVTPFTATGELDEAGFLENLQFQIKSGVDGVVVMGTTGESHSITSPERERILTLAAEKCADKILFIVGIIANSTNEALTLAQQAKQAGADAILVVAPYYNKPTQAGIYAHFQHLCEANLPIIAYNNPARSGVHIDVLTLAEIARLPNLVGLKDSSGSGAYVADALHHTRDLDKPFAILSGDDPTLLSTLALGGHGAIATMSNLTPVPMVQLYKTQDRDLFFQLFPLIKAQGFEANPIPIKEMMNQCGLPAGPCRLPLSPISEPHRASIHQLLADARLLPAGAPT